MLARISIYTSEIGDISALLGVDLRLDEERVEAVEEKVPGEDVAVAHRVVQLVERLQHHWSVDNDAVELRLEAHHQRLDGAVVDGAEEEGGALRHLHVQVVHAADQVAEGVRQRRVQRLLVLQRRRVQETRDHCHSLHCKHTHKILLKNC